MSKIPQQIVEEIQRSTDIVGLIQSYIPLRRAGVNFKAVCPFHSEKTASFVVSPAKQIYHCFGCQAGGNVFHFLMAMEKLSFIEAVRDLAQKAGIALPKITDAAPVDSFQSQYFEIYQFAAQFYAAALRRCKIALDYLRAARGLKNETLQAFQIGYAPASWNELLQAAQKKGYSAEQLEKAGLALTSRGGWHDRFVNRILFPIWDTKGRVIGFGGRAMGEAMPKYLNSPETDAFKKGRILYGLHLTKNEIVKEKQALVLEGYMDLIGLYQAGIRNAVATLGTALTVDHVRNLTRFAEEVIISYDGDKAGADASLRGIDLLVEESCQVRVLTLPSGFDPDDFVLQKGVDAFRALVKSAPFFLDYKLAKLCERYDLKTPYGQRDIARAMMGVIGRMRDELLRNAWIRRCSQQLKLSEEVLRREMTSDAGKTAAPEARAGTSAAATNALLSVENEVCRWLLEEPQLASFAIRELKKEDFEDPILRRAFEKMALQFERGEWQGVASLLRDENDTQFVSRMSALAAQSVSASAQKRKFEDAAALLRRKSLERQLRILTQEVANRERAQQEVESLLKEILEKRRQLEKI